MSRVLTSAIGIAFLSPIACSGVPHDGQDAGIGGALTTGGTGGQTECATEADCAPNQICEQIMFPIMPPGGFGGSAGSNNKLGVCRDAGPGGSGNTGGANGTGDTNTAGGSANTGGASATTQPAVSGGAAGAGGTSSRTPCNVTTAAECAPHEVCQQVIFPVMPPPGYDGGLSNVKLGECVPAEQSMSARFPEADPSEEADRWWREAEAALRHG